MSEDGPTNRKARKARKAQRDAERHKGSKKRKRDEEHQDDFIPLTSDAVAEAELEAQLSAQAEADPTKRSKIGPLRSYSRGRLAEQRHGHKRRKVEEFAEAEGVEPPPERKKRRKGKKQTERQRNQLNGGAVAAVNTQTNGEEGEEETNASTPNKTRFILFIGNLPYSTTDASLQNYFKSIAPFTLRHRTDPATKKSKGFAFLEFENFDRMQTCIKLYHHSMFNPDVHSGSSVDRGAEGMRKGKDRGARKINVELTAGGGGSKEGRMEKIKAKNVRLDEQRKRKAEAERKEKEKERLKEAEGKGQDGGGGKKKGQNATARYEGDLKSAAHVRTNEQNASQVHPSRLARVMG